MQKSCIANNGGMMKVQMDLETLQKICQVYNRVTISGYNSDGVYIISGDKDEIYKVSEAMTYFEASHWVLDVAGAYHSIHMSKAREELKTFLKDELNFKNVLSNFNFISSTDGKVKNGNTDFVSLLSSQLTLPVDWVEVCNTLTKLNPDLIFSIGPRRTIEGLLKSNNPDFNVVSVRKPNDILNFINK